MGNLLVTLNPSRITERDLAWTMNRGVGGFRVNLARKDEATNLRTIDMIRRVGSRLGCRAFILTDLPGPKARLGKVGKSGLQVAGGQRIILSCGKEDSVNEVPFRGSWLCDQLTNSDKIEIGRRRIRARLVRIAGESMEVEFECEGVLRNYDAIIPLGGIIPMHRLTENDKEHCRFAIRAGADAVAPSFVSSPGSIKDVRTIAKAIGRTSCSTIAKIESVAGAENCDEIILASDGFLVGRDDFSRVSPAPQVNRFIDDCLAKYRTSKTVMAASSYFRHLATRGKPEATECALVEDLAARGLHFIVSDETAYSDYYRRIIDTAIRCGFR